MPTTTPTTLKMFLPQDVLYQDSFATATSMSASTPSLAFIFMAAVDCVVSAVTLRIASVTTTGTIKVGIQSVTPGGPSFPATPSEIWLGDSGNGAGTQASIASNTTYDITLAETVALTRGTSYAIVIEWVGTPGSATVYRTVNSALSMLAARGDITSYFLSKGAVWTWIASSRPGTSMAVGLRHNANHWWMPSWALLPSSTSAPTPNNVSSPNEYGNKLYLPKCQLTGLWAVTNCSTSTSLTLYDALNNTVFTDVLPYAYRAANSYAPLLVYPASPIPIAEGWYRAAIKSTVGTACTVYTATYSANQQNARQMKDLCLLTTRTGTGAWTDQDTGQTLVGVEIGFDLPSDGFPLSRLMNRI